MPARYACGDAERRALVREAGGLDGIDFLEVLDHEAPEPLRQQLLVVRVLAGALAGFDRDHVRLEGGVRVSPVPVRWALPLPDVAGAPPALVSQAEKDFLAAYFAAETEPGSVLVVRTEGTGDFSVYRLVLVDPASGQPPPAGFDPRLSAVEFSFKVECPSPFDCKTAIVCPPPDLAGPEIDYLAKDYASFRRLLLDRLAVLAPEWRERSPADLGVALVELLAYAGDHLSYYQDAVATEAYPGTARRRVSLRRHVRLEDYFLHEGANARAWVALEVDAGADGALLPGPDAQAGAPGTVFVTRALGAGPTLPPEELEAAAAAGAVVFESLAGAVLHQALGEIALYTWSDRECCLPAGATAATLVGPLPLRAGRSRLLQGRPLADESQAPGLGDGDFLLFEEVLGPRTGDAADADPAHRHVVRLTRVGAATDPLDGTAVVEIEWDEADALPFPLCISARTDAAHGGRYVEGVSVARGNVVPADHGRSVAGAALAPAPEDRPFRPRLAAPALTHAAPLPAGFTAETTEVPEELAPAAALFTYTPAAATPALRLEAADGAWLPRRDLLESGPFARELVVEMDDERRAHLRFGDGVHGRRPPAGTLFLPRYRVGGGPDGNVGAGALAQVVTGLGGILRVRNPLPARGGLPPEPVEDARRYAPQAFRVQLRAVTEEDYARAAERHPEVQRAAATFRWTGSWYTVFVTVDRKEGLPVDAAFEERLRQHLGFFRMAGYDLEVDGPRPVPLEVELQVCVALGHLRSHVLAALLAAFSSRALPDGGKGFFHPDRWTFGQPVYLSELIAAAAAVAGVESVEAVRFQRRGRPPAGELDDGVLPIGRLEIAQLDNDPNFPENGRLAFQLGGGA
jgi:hypothetical protein